jgi:uncharacterized protein YndB with AHSA1/START domain
MSQAIISSRTVNASPEQVYKAFTSEILIREWMSNGATLQNQVGGGFLFTWNQGYQARGEILRLEENKLVEMMWHGLNEPGPSNVTVALEGNGSKTTVTITHTVPGDEGWKEAARTFKQEWDSGLENLQSILETGDDLRLTRRFILGVIPTGPLDEAQAKKLGIPVVEGILISGTVPNTGAAEANLQKDDAIVEVEGKPIKGRFDIPAALQGKKANEEASLTFYRGATKHTVTFRLSPMTMADVPENPVEFAARAEEMFNVLHGEMTEVLDGVTDQDALHHPGNDDSNWNVKDVLAHLILTERWNQMWIGSLVAGAEIQNWMGNHNTAIRPLSTAYGSLEAILNEFKLSCAVTVETVKALPEGFNKDNPGSYERVGQNILQTPFHIRGHISQIQEAVEDARSQ